ncbi:flagellar biosynthesis protein, FliO [Geobacter sp. OR-1]|uniref:flagellar biosynthetic protein FliO n=1 Tax=Geobacter sp. OR-1 TaxID=1266765 RepID=UPI000542A331|nr:flagellar biosynthetic protein FliO [Geobacter sp. OR-1]GAM09686.1 flagellar biosynthesis protein, FliO [Geobacter sp. OR-1]
MRLISIAPIMPVFAGEALAQGQSPLEGPSLLWSMLQTIAALAVVVGLILLFYYVSNRWLRAGLATGNQQKYIRVIETRFLAPKKSLVLVEVGGEYLLLSSSGDGLQFIKQVDMLEEIEVIDSPMLGKLVPENLQNKIIDLMARRPRKNTAEAPMRTAGGSRS